MRIELGEGVCVGGRLGTFVGVPVGDFKVGNEVVCKRRTGVGEAGADTVAGMVEVDWQLTVIEVRAKSVISRARMPGIVTGLFAGIVLSLFVDDEVSDVNCDVFIIIIGSGDNPCKGSYDVRKVLV